MIICICNAVSDGHIRAAAMEGASCIRDIARDLRVGICCGKCVPEAKAVLAKCLARQDEVATPGYFPGAAEFAV